MFIHIVTHNLFMLKFIIKYSFIPYYFRSPSGSLVEHVCSAYINTKNFDSLI